MPKISDIQLYHSTTAGNVPTAADLLPGELAINTADGKLFYEDDAGVVQTFSITLTDLGVTATSTELNYVDGVTSNIQTQLNGKAATSHDQDASTITTGTLSYLRLPNATSSTKGAIRCYNSGTTGYIFTS